MFLILQKFKKYIIPKIQSYSWKIILYQNLSHFVVILQLFFFFFIWHLLTCFDHNSSWFFNSGSKILIKFIFGSKNWSFSWANRTLASAMQSSPHIDNANLILDRESKFATIKLSKLATERGFSAGNALVSVKFATTFEGLKGKI